MAKHRSDRDSWGECTYSISNSPHPAHRVLLLDDSIIKALLSSWLLCVQSPIIVMQQDLMFEKTPRSGLPQAAGKNNQA